jgi:TonB family protein
MAPVSAFPVAMGGEKVCNRPMKFVVLLLLVAGAMQSQELAPMAGPKVIQKVDPEYTKEAAAAKIEGTVILSTVIDTNGMPTEINLVKGLDRGLDQKAVECLQQWRFSPGLRRGEPASVKATVEIQFRLASKTPNQN